MLRTTFDDYEDDEPRFIGSIFGLVVNAEEGRILWPLEGPAPSSRISYIRSKTA